MYFVEKHRWRLGRGRATLEYDSATDGIVVGIGTATDGTCGILSVGGRGRRPKDRTLSRGRGRRPENRAFFRTGIHLVNSSSSGA